GLEFAGGRVPVGNVDKGAAGRAAEEELASLGAGEGDEGELRPALPAAVGQGGGAGHLGGRAAGPRDDRGLEDVAGRLAGHALVEGLAAEQYPGGIDGVEDEGA